MARPRNKTRMLTVKLSDDTYAEFKAVSEMRRASMSELVHQFLIVTIREERAHAPTDFARTLARIYGEMREAEVVKRDAAATLGIENDPPQTSASQPIKKSA